MPPEASSRPEIGLNFIDTSTSLYGPGGATMTLNWFLVARCTSTFLPLGAPTMSSTAHWPSTVVQPSMPFASKSNLTTGTLSGTLSSSAAAAVGNRDHRATTSAASVFLNIPRRVPFMRILAPNLRGSLPAFADFGVLASIELRGHGLPLGVLHQRDVGHGMTLLQCGHDADDAVPLVLLHGLGRSGIEGPLRFGHRLALPLRRREVVAA